MAIAQAAVLQAIKGSSKTVITRFGKFDSMVDATKFEGVRVQTLPEWVKNSIRLDYEFL